MKNLIIVISSLCVLLIANTNLATAQVKYAAYSYNAYGTFNSEVEVVKTEIRKSGYTIVDTDVTTLSRYQQFPWDLTCYAGREYIVFGYTEAGIDDLGLYIYDSKGNFVTANPASKNIGITATKFNAYSTTKARIIAKNEKSVSSLKDYKVAIIVAYRYR